MDKIFEFIRNTIDGNDIVLFMKGSADFPQCGFSGKVVFILKKMGVEFKDLDVLRDPVLRQGVKDFSDWPTVPQLYIKGEFVGGCDIVSEMYETGELKALIDKIRS